MTVLPGGLDDLRALVRVAAVGSIGQAARSLGVSQPALSRRLAALERSWGLTLLERSRRGTSLTSDGAVVVDWAATLLDEVDGFDRAVRALVTRAAPSVRVAASMTIAEHYAPYWVSRLTARHPDVEVALEVHNSTGVIAAVEAGRVELGFIESPALPGHLRRQRVGWDRLVVAVLPDHPWAADSHGPVSPAEFASASLLLREPGSGTRETMEHQLRRHRLHPHGAVELASNTALKAAALVGLGPVVLAEVALAQELATGRLRAVEVDGFDLRRPLTALWSPDHQLGPRASDFLLVTGAAEPQSRAR